MKILTLFFMLLTLNLYASQENLNNDVKVFNDWVVVCNHESTQKYCYMSQSLHTQVDEQKVRLLQLGIDKTTANEFVAKIILPLGVDLKSGITLQTIGKALGTNELKIEYHTCLNDGCLAIAKLSPNFLRSLELGNTAKVAFKPFNSDQTAILDISLNGFLKAKEQL